MSTISKQKIQDIARLARLSLTEAEIEQYSQELSVVFDYFETLNEVDTSDLQETNQVTGLRDVVREDVPEKISKEQRQKFINSFPQKTGNMLKVKAVFDSET